jgi:hypothetical protein
VRGLREGPWVMGTSFAGFRLCVGWVGNSRVRMGIWPWDAGDAGASRPG